MFPLAILPVGVIVLALAACGMSAPATNDPGSQTTGLRCILAITERDGQLQIEGLLEPTAAVTGRYVLTIAQTGRAGQNFIDQSGDFTASAGENLTLGSASISGSAAQYDATLTLQIDQTTVTCPVTLTGR